MIGVLNILQNDIGVTQFTGDSIHVEEAEETESGPFVVLKVTDSEPYDSKTSVSTLDKLTLQVLSYARDSDRALRLNKSVRSALDGKGQETYADEFIQSIRFISSDSGKVKMTRNDWYIWEHIYDVYIDQEISMGFYVGDIKTSLATTPQDNTWKLCDGSLLSRTTHKSLYDIRRIDLSGTTTNASATVVFADTSSLYVGMKLEGAGIPSGTTISSVDTATEITLSSAATASATTTVSFLSPLESFGDGATTFGIPDLRSRLLIGSGQGTGLISRELGESGGHEDTNSIPASTQGNNNNVAPNSGSVFGMLNSGRSFDFSYYDGGADVTISGANADANIGPNAAVNYMIKVK